MADDQQVMNVVERQDRIHQLQQENNNLRLMVQMMQTMQMMMRALEALQYREQPATQQQPSQPVQSEQQARIENLPTKAGGKSRSRAAFRRQRRANGWYNRGGRGHGGRYDGHGSGGNGNKHVVINMYSR